MRLLRHYITTTLCNIIGKVLIQKKRIALIMKRESEIWNYTRKLFKK
ncbi:hypothetical protein [Mucilaginibacter celer]|nr:hypothetical protein [Mucilaginibacter celer]